MARGSKNTPAQSKKNAGKADAGRVALKQAGAAGRKAAAQDADLAPAPRIFDERTKRDMGGVACGVIAVALFVAAVLPPSGFITSALSEALHAGLGIGCYLLPFALVAVAACMLMRTERDYLAFRMGIGLFLILVSLMTLLALFTPGAADDPSLLFSREGASPVGSADQLAVRGGYVGAGIAWALIELFGQVIGCVIAVGAAVSGIVVIGFSLTGSLAALHEKGRAFRDARRERAQKAASAAEDGPDDAAFEPAPAGARRRPFGRIRRSLDPDAEGGMGAAGVEAAPTRRIDPVPHVPRDLSRPRRAQSSLSTQVLGASRTAQGGPHASSVDMYWPSDYAYDEARAASEQMQEETSAKTRVLGIDEGPRAKTKRRASGDAARAASALPWEDDADAGAGDASGASGAPASARFERAAGQEKPMTRKLARRERGDAGASHAARTADSSQPSSGSAVSATSAASSASATRALAATAAATAAAAEAPGEVRGGFTLPAFSLIRHTARAEEADQEELAATAAELQGTLEDFSIMATVVGWVAGPTVTLFKVDLPSGVRVSRIVSLQDDIALALAAPGVRIFAPIPGTNHVGIEVPNRTRQNVLLGDVIKDAKGSPLEMAIGKDVEGHSIVTDLAKMPHLLIGGTTGSGKSVAINAMIMSILMRATPDEVRFIMIDPKRVEFTPYNGIPHLYVPVVTENKEAASALAWGVAEMERRLKVMSKAGVRNISQYNAKVESGALDPDVPDESQPGQPTRQLSIDDIPESPKKMPYIVIIDELADLMMNVGKEVELSISRIAQLARAAGIHMIVATQRPSTNLVTGLIKANITNRIAFNVASGIDSRVILDTPGAENLIGLGDMLFSKPEWPKPQRLQGCFVSEDEIEAVVAHLKAQGEPEYHSEILKTNVIGLGASMPDGSGGASSADDPLLWEAADIVVSSGLGSTSNIQRRLSVGYSRAGRIMDMLEEKGIVGPPNGSKPREVLVDEMELESLKAFEAQDAAQAG